MVRRKQARESKGQVEAAAVGGSTATAGVRLRKWHDVLVIDNSVLVDQ